MVRKVALASVLIGLCVTWLSGNMDRRLDWMLDSKRIYYNALEMPSDGRPALVATAPDNEFRWPTPPGAGLGVRIQVAYLNLKQRLGIRDAARTRMWPSMTNQQWRVYQGLGRCTEITGRRYLAAEEALERVVTFGTSNQISGAQWAANFEQAVRDNGWLLITGRLGLVTVIPKDKLEEYQTAGLAKPRN